MGYLDYKKKKDVGTQGVASVLKEKNPDGYFNAKLFVADVDRLADNRKTEFLVGNTAFLVDSMKAGLNFGKMPQHVVEDGEPFSWIQIRAGRVLKNIKVPHIGDMKRFIDDYAMGAIKVTQTFDELYEECNS